MKRSVTLQILTSLILALLPRGVAADDAEDLLVNFEDGYGGKVYYIEINDVTGWRSKCRLLEFGLDEKNVREVATFRNFLLRSAGVAEMTRDGGSLYIVEAPQECEDNWDYSLIAMAWNGVRGVFETKEAIPIPAAQDERLTILYQYWDDTLRLNFFKPYTKHIEEQRRKTGAGEEVILWGDCY